jgi:nucleoside-diphosphate-sugar epimerase
VKQILVTGSTGKVGSTVVECLLRAVPQHLLRR